MSRRNKTASRESALLSAMAERYGEDGEKLLTEVEKIAFGTAEARTPTGLDGTLDRITKPTIAERLQALQLLLAYQQGRPIARTEVAIDMPKKADPNWDALTIQELEQMERLTAKRDGKKSISAGLAAGVVDAEFKVEPAPVPAGEPSDDDEGDDE